MKEVAHITRDVSDKPSSYAERETRTLVIVDELGRGTSPTDGLSIAWAVTERLMQHNAFVLFVTHYNQLNTMQSVYPNVRNCHLCTSSAACGRLQYSYMVKSGACTKTSYGLSAAEVSGLPKSMLSVARQVVAKAAAKKIGRDAAFQKSDEPVATVLKLVGKLGAIKGTVLATNESALRGHLKALQAELQVLTEMSQ